MLYHLLSYSCLILSVQLSKATASACQLMLSPIKACSKGILKATWWRKSKVHLQNQLRHSRGCSFQSLHVPSVNLLSLEGCRIHVLLQIWHNFSFQLGAHLPWLRPWDHGAHWVTLSPSLSSQINLSPDEITHILLLTHSSLLLVFILYYFLKKGGLLLPWWVNQVSSRNNLWQLFNNSH